MKRLFLIIAFMLSMVLIYSCNEQPPVNSEEIQDNAEPKTLSKINYPEADFFVVEYSTDDVEFNNSVASLGGKVDRLFSEIKVAQVSKLTDQTAAALEKMGGITSVTRDLLVQWTDPDLKVVEESIGSDETFWAYQWAPRAIHAPEAWDAGYTGNGVRVAVIDGGISSNHIDLKDNIDFSASKSFVPGYNFDEDGPGFRHATHVAGIIAAEDNGIGTIGVAPHATIIALKALHHGSGTFSAVIAATMYAANEARADIINMSLGAVFPRNSNAAAKLNSALGHAMNYAYQKGVTIIVAGGNDAIDFDHAGPWISMPSEAQHVINISATGPVDFAYGGTNYDRPASYTNYGQSFIDFAAPGGDFVSANPLWYMDMVLSPSYVLGSSNRYSWAAGTSMAAPHAAGVAALIIEANGASISPAQVATKLRASADDLGKPGNDDFYGKGRVNAFLAVTK